MRARRLSWAAGEILRFRLNAHCEKMSPNVGACMKYPILFVNSRVPVWLSKFAPIEVYAVSFGPWVWCRGICTTRMWQHETIHYRQQLEFLFVGQWLLYGLFWLLMFAKYRDGRAAYWNNPFEREAYTHELDPHYLEDRKLYAWRRYIFDNCHEP